MQRDKDKRKRQLETEAPWWLTSEPANCGVCCAPLRPMRPATQKYCSKRCAKLRRRRIDNAKERATPHGRIKDRLSNRLRDIIARKGGQKFGPTTDLFGCTPKELAAHIASQFDSKMSWDNYGVTGWHVDHIIPCERFDLSQHEHQRVCFNYRNLRPLWGETNWTRAHWMNLEDRMHLNPELFSEASKLGIKM